MISEPLEIIRKSLDLLGSKYKSREAEIMLLAIGFQESEWKYRKQHGNGPAKGFFMFEPIAVEEVLSNRATTVDANRVCRELQINSHNVYQALEKEKNDILAVCFARLLLWRDPKPLPKNWSDAWY